MEKNLSESAHLARLLADLRVCPRCQVAHPEGDFRGEVCGWCADDLERVAQRDRRAGRVPAGPDYPYGHVEVPSE